MHASELTFGVEIESMVPLAYVRVGDYQQGSYHHGLPIWTLPQGWTGERDSSIADRRGYAQIEVVSPILKGEPGLVEVVYAADDMRTIGARVNRTCGGHVTFAAPRSHLVRERLGRLLYHYQVTLFGINGREMLNRWRSPYCKPTATVAPTSPGKMYAFNWSKPGLLEFRLFAGTLDAKALIARISACAALIAAAHDGADAEGAAITDPVLGMVDFQKKILARYPIVDGVQMSDVKAHLTWQAKAAGKLLA